MSLVKRYARWAALTLPVLFLALVLPASVMPAVVGFGLMGLTISLSAKGPDGDEQTFVLNTDDQDSFLKTLKGYVALTVQSALAPVKSALAASEAESTALRDLVTGEIIRIKKLSSKEPDKFDAETEKLYLAGDPDKNIPGLPASRLKVEFDRLPKREELKVESATTGDPPSDTPGGDPYADLALPAVAA